jgi:hypothetical protein
MKHPISVIGYYYESRVPARGADAQVESGYSMPELRHYHCQGSRLAQRARMHCRKSVRTGIVHDYSGILVINHPGGDQWDGRQEKVDAAATRGTGNVYISRP